MAFRVGQKVVCVDDVADARRSWGCAPLRKGAIYHVRDYVPSYYGTDEPVIRLCEIVRRNDECGFRAARFEAVVEKSTDAGMSILQEILDRESHDERKPACV